MQALGRGVARPSPSTLHTASIPLPTCDLMASITSFSARMRSSSSSPSVCTACRMRSEDLPLAPAKVVRKLRSSPEVLASCTSRWRSRSARPISSSIDLRGGEEGEMGKKTSSSL